MAIHSAAVASAAVWQVQNTPRALFDVDVVDEFVAFQSETAVRHIADSCGHGRSDPNDMPLPGNTDEIMSKLSTEVTAVVATWQFIVAGVLDVVESAIEQVELRGIVKLGHFQRSDPVANLMVVL
ncbi:MULTISPECIES: hypothetical protein [Brevibacterium]|uniref:Uncharacterized protein n=1 Tax=Brevibacterium antiquum CNRZ 918 TaxID=1255637 RepID=A0A2H1HUL5_9MICO|nr:MULTISPECIES: hypothetical protein [Brevibacterium]SMX66602.1 hypothetical protein BANT918_00513 [Brevibacterium antiquum CNRZ 918]HCG56340.1 hypothetical protein [Brevibacterium sp.]